MPLYQLSGGTPYKKSAAGGLSELFGAYTQSRQEREERLRRQQMQDLQMRMLRRQMGQMEQPPIMHPSELAYKEAATQKLRGETGQIGLPSPVSKEEAANLQARTGLATAQTKKLGLPALQQTSIVESGGINYLINTQTGQIIQDLGPVTPAEYRPDIIQNIETGEQRYIKPGEDIPMGWQVSKPPTSAVSVSIGGEAGLEKSTKGAVEREIKTIDDTLAIVNRISETTKDEYLTYGGKFTAGATRFGEKWGIAETLKDVPMVGGVIDKEFLRGYSIWLMGAQEIYLKKRHEITGVAANPAEKEEIALAIPDPIKNSPTEFKAKTAELIRLLTQSRNRLIIFRALGIPNPTKEQLSRVSLGQVPLDPEEARKQAPHIMLGATEQETVPPPPPGFIID